MRGQKGLELGRDGKGWEANLLAGDNVMVDGKVVSGCVGDSEVKA